MEASLKQSLFYAALLAGAIAGAGTAIAADDMPPEFRSSTFEVYIGAFGSANALNSEYREADVDDPLGGYLDGTAAGFGMRAGVDYVMNGWVLGAVADWSFGGSIAREAENDAELDMPNLATIRARAGFTAGSAIVYATGGYAQAEMEFAVNSEDGILTGSDSDWTSGWTVGAGVDVAVTQQVTVGLEYLYLHLDDVNYSTGDSDAPVGVDHDIDGIHSIRLGMNYAFQI